MTTTITPYPTATELPPTQEHSPEWHTQRAHGIGSSDASTVLGLNPYKSPYTLWAEKTGKHIEQHDERTQELFHWGHMLEPLIREETARQLNTTITKPETTLAHTKRTWQRANLDGITTDNIIFEAKTTSERNRDLWIDQIPDHAEIQVHHTGAVTGLTHAHVAGLIGGNELIIHTIELNPNIINMLTEAEETFWHHVQTDTPPPIDGSPATLKHLTSEIGRTHTTVEAPLNTTHDIMTRYWQARHQREEAEKAENAAKAELAQLLGTGSTLTTGNTVWVKTRAGRINETQLKADHPDLYSAYNTKTVFNPQAFKTDHPDLYATYQNHSMLIQKLTQ